MSYSTYQKIATFMQQDPAYIKHLYKSHWISGCSTEVYPVTYYNMKERQEIIVQWDSDNLNTARHFINRTGKKFNEVKRVWFNRSDGSCPSTISIVFD